MGGGGYVAGPGGLAALRLGLPLVLTEADRHLGLANRLLARRARRVCLAFEIPGLEGERYVVTGRPVPAAILAADRGAARERFGIEADRPCLLVFGGSQGARSINLAALDAFAGPRARPRRTPIATTTSSTSRDTATTPPPRPASRLPAAAALHAAGVRARARRRPRRLRPGARPLRRLDLRARRRGPAGDSGPLSACGRRSPAQERRVDARRRGGSGDRRRGARRRAPWRRPRASS